MKQGMLRIANEIQVSFALIGNDFPQQATSLREKKIYAVRISKSSSYFNSHLM